MLSQINFWVKDSMSDLLVAGLSHVNVMTRVSSKWIFSCEKAVAIGISYRIRNRDLGGLYSDLLKAGPTPNADHIAQSLIKLGKSWKLPSMEISQPLWAECSIINCPQHEIILLFLVWTRTLCILWPFSVTLSPCTSVTDLALSSQEPLRRYWKATTRSTRSFPFSRLNKASSFGLSS